MDSNASMLEYVMIIITGTYLFCMKAKFSTLFGILFPCLTAVVGDIEHSFTLQYMQ